MWYIITRPLPTHSSLIQRSGNSHNNKQSLESLTFLSTPMDYYYALLGLVGDELGDHADPNGLSLVKTLAAKLENNDQKQCHTWSRRVKRPNWL